jgi:hypothetical protein
MEGGEASREATERLPAEASAQAGTASPEYADPRLPKAGEGHAQNIF